MKNFNFIPKRCLCFVTTALTQSLFVCQLWNAERRERENEKGRETKNEKVRKRERKKRTRNDCLNNKRPTLVAKKSLAAAFCPTFNKFLLDSYSQRRKSKQQFCDLSRNLGWVLQTVFFSRDHQRTFKISYECSALLGKTTLRTWSRKHWKK